MPCVNTSWCRTSGVIEQMYSFGNVCLMTILVIHFKLHLSGY
eukprot:gene2793-13581_t